ncbi:MAG TPA: hypothetical protein VMD91_16095 [Candidatus Sulfotelmatobacter sp.]|nr:hypothetical protein [Candidatus Sulfotelmatobacter sp.]
MLVALGGSALGKPNWSHHSKPFDLVWDRNNEDLNGLPLNPQWGYQLDNPGKLPNFQSICGGAFYNAQGMPASSTSGSGNNAVNNAILARTCTSQHTSLDVSTSSYVGDWALAHLGGMSSAYCTSGAGGFNGHLTWTVATYTGTVLWSDWSGNPSFFSNFDLADGDYNLDLFPSQYPPDDNAGFTSLNDSKSGEYGIGLEFNDGETVDNAGSAWWKQLVNSVENGGQPSPGQLFMSGPRSSDDPLGALSAVVTGVVGIDGVHGDYAEVHPVFALAVRTSSSSSKGKVTETWSYFLRDSGSGGGCSSSTLYWEAPQFDDSRDARFFIGLPWPQNATAVKVLQSNGFSWQGEQPVAGSWVGASGKKGWTEVDVVFYDKAQNYVGGLDGQVTLEYTVSSTSSQKKATPHAPAPKTEPEKFREDEFKVTDIDSWIPDAATRSAFQADAKAALGPLVARPTSKTVTAQRLASAIEPRPSRTAASNEQLTPAKAAPDPAKQRLNTALKTLTDKYRPQLRPLHATTTAH